MEVLFRDREREKKKTSRKKIEYFGVFLIGFGRRTSLRKGDTHRERGKKMYMTRFYAHA